MPVPTKDNKLLKYLVNLIEVQNPDEAIDEFREVVWLILLLIKSSTFLKLGIDLISSLAPSFITKTMSPYEPSPLGIDLTSFIWL